MPMPPRLTLVGELERPDHHYLPAQARCCFWGEYTSQRHVEGPVWQYSDTNALITNFKKKVDRQGMADWRYKGQAIDTIAQAFSGFWRWPVLHQQHRVALVPVPPSRARNDPMYDPRMLDVLRGISARSGLPLDVRDCLSFSGAHAASHEADERPSPDDLFEDLSFDATAGRPQEQPGVIFLFDDMLTTGAHYVAVHRVLAQHFPGIEVLGNFVSRRAIPNPFAPVGGSLAAA
jgi:predicted amidophosphoribosyltransferase